eukprot:CAMPEP_0205931464 /NCGR_PEP_ID=MMETSP1325-20131115/27447_1 /ASSEMBLY_ACC=CAM_ASM_000708 /TAXON_ID=236786 /ORGANISM="Florenciella sp., Strain RCC1007" /LENGTH=80 /DNA_ID=CAMNT_0053301035 /DNA_START=35 /DNA_END=273 /DNA_ORIENTATION=-
MAAAAAASASPGDESWRIERIGGPATDDDWFPDGRHGNFTNVGEANWHEARARWRNYKNPHVRPAPPPPVPYDTLVNGLA